MDKITLIGNLGKDPEMRYTKDGTPVTNFSLATNRKLKDGSKITKWYRISVWGGQAEPCVTYLHKGSQACVEGTLLADEHGNPKIWTRKDGTPASSFEVRAFSVEFLSSGGGGDGESHTVQEDPYGDVFDNFANVGAEI